MQFKFKPKSQILSILIILCCFGSSSYAATKAIETGYIPVKGGKLYYEKFGVKSEQAIIVLHGGPGMDSSYLLPQMAQLADSNHEVVFYDQRGSGKSLGFALDIQSINIDNFVADLEALRTQLGYKKIVLVGHSWGGLLAMRYATLHPDNLKSLILVSPAPSSSTGIQVFFDEFAKRARPIKAQLEKIENSELFIKGDPAVVKQYHALLFSNYIYNKANLPKLTLNFTQQAALNGREISKIFVENYLNHFDLTPELNKLTMPVLVVHGVDDIIPLETAKQTHRAIPGSQMVVIEKCDHFPYIEQPKELFSVMHKFIAFNHQ